MVYPMVLDHGSVDISSMGQSMKLGAPMAYSMSTHRLYHLISITNTNGWIHGIWSMVYAMNQNRQ